MTESEGTTKPDLPPTNGRGSVAKLRAIEAELARHRDELYGKPGEAGGIKPLCQSMRDDIKVLSLVATDQRNMVRVLIVTVLAQFMLLGYATLEIRGVYHELSTLNSKLQNVSIIPAVKGRP